MNAITNPYLPNPQSVNGVSFFARFIPALVGMGLVIGSVVFLFIFIIGGIQWMASGEDKAALEAAKSKVVNALVGFILLICLFGILNLVQNFYGVRILTLDIGVLRIQ